MLLALHPRTPLCFDVCRIVLAWSQSHLCRRCGAPVRTQRGATRMCFVRDECLCFVCYHRVRARPQ